MSYLSGKQVEKIVVPVHCESEQGTAFFISRKQLLTARHVVKAHFQSAVSKEPIYIYVAGKKILCRGEELSLPNNNIDLALLTIDEEESYCSDEFLPLLCDEYIHELNLHLYGYPQEVAMGCNLVQINVKNGLEIENSEWGDRALIREDKLTICNYDGLSGAPIVTQSGRVIGIIVVQINETLKYLSILKAKAHLEGKGIKYETDWKKDDITTMGQGRCMQLVEEAIAMVPGRYTPNLHQSDAELETILGYFVNNKPVKESFEKVNALAQCILTLPVQMLGMVLRRLKVGQKLNEEKLMQNDGFLLKVSLDYLNENPFQSMGRNMEVEKLYKIAQQVDDVDFERLRYVEKKNLYLIGKAGSGKTHNLCRFAETNQDKANIYLFFGTDFQLNKPVFKTIREKVCEAMSFEDFNNELVRLERNAIIIIDAINEGVGCSYWNNHLQALRVELEKYSHIRLIISIRSPFDQDIKELSSSQWCRYKIEGFKDVNSAVDTYFNEWGVDRKYKEQRITAFKNPLFLKLFCETYMTLTEEERMHISKQTLYRQYVYSKNEEVSEKVDEDPELNIANQYLLQLAHYSVFTGHFNPISRSKARLYARRMAPYRMWHNDLLNACLTTNLLLADHSQSEEPAVMFEYENLGDYYKANAILQSKRDKQSIIRFLEAEKAYLERHPLIPSQKFKNAAKALFDSWYQQGVDIDNENAIQAGGSLNDLYYEYLVESELSFDELRTRLLKLDKDAIDPTQLIKDFDDLSYEETLLIHEKLKSYTIARRDMLWTRYINQMYEWNGDELLREVPIEHDHTLPVSNEERDYLIGTTWMLSSSHPRFRALLIRKLRSILLIHQSLIIWLIEMFEDVNDPYVVGGLYCAVCGVVLPSRDKQIVTKIANHIYSHYYEDEKAVPLDLIVRQWTLKIIERAYYIDEKCDCWKRIKTPFRHKPIDETTMPRMEDINEEYFGVQHGSMLLYDSVFKDEDFNRYIIGTNSRLASCDYFRKTEKGKYQGVPLQEIMTELAYYIKNVFCWNDKLGYLDNGKYSINRAHNEQERIGKKYQWLAWYRLNAHLMDTCRTTKEQYYYQEEAEEKDFAITPYPWNCSDVSRFDPTLDIKQRYEANAGLSGVESQAIGGKEFENWIEDNAYLPLFRWLARQQDGTEYVMLMGYDKSEDGNKDTFLFSNAGFVKKEYAKKFAQWAQEQNFYGRWMPERQGTIEFLWSDYPWADTYKSQVEHDDGALMHDCPCEMKLSYEAQLQEDWEGIAHKDEYLSTVYMPNVEMMEQLGLYCSEIRGVVKDKYGREVALNTDYKDGVGINGLFIRKDMLDEYLRRNDYVMFYYVLGEKLLRKSEKEFIMKDLSASYQYNPVGAIIPVQQMRVIEKNAIQRNRRKKAKLLTEFQKKKVWSFKRC